MKQLIQMFLIDVQMNFRHFMGAYIVIVPLAILLVLRFFIPTIETTTATIVVVNEGKYAVDQKTIDLLDEYAKIKTFGSIEGMERKLKGTGSAEGLYWDPDKAKYISVLERTLEGMGGISVASQVLRQNYFEEKYPDSPLVMTFEHGVPEELSDRTKTSPVATMGGSIYLVFLIIITGFVIGMGIVEDKENGTDRALWVSPVSKTDYFVGKSIYPLLVSAFYTIVCLLILGLMHVNILQIYLVVILAFPVTMLFGLILGALAGNENEAIGIGKMLAMVVMLSILGGTLLPDAWQWIVYWAPFYWMYNIIEGIFTETSTWISLIWKLALMLGTTALYFMLLRKRIVKGLS